MIDPVPFFLMPFKIFGAVFLLTVLTAIALMVINSVVKIPIRPDGLIEKGGMYLLVGSFCGLTGTAVGLISVAAVWGAAGAGFTALSIGDPILAVFWLVVSILLVPPALAATVAAFVFPWTITHE